MPWYWTDDVANLMVSTGRMDETELASLIAMPVAHRSEHQDIEDAIQEMLDDGEIPLAA